MNENAPPKERVDTERGLQRLYSLDGLVVHRVGLLLLGQLVVTQGIIILAGALVDARDVVVGTGAHSGGAAAMSQGYGLAVGPDGLGGAPGLLVGEPQIAVGLAVVAIDLDGLAVQIDGLVQLAGVVGPLALGGAELIASKSPMTESLIEIQSIPKLKRSISVF